MPYLTDQKCSTEECSGRPFVGETASPGYCDDCHADRMTAELMLEELERLATDSIDDDESDYFAKRDEILTFGDDHPAAREVFAGYGLPT